MGGVVLAEHEVQQAAVGVHNGQGVELMLPDDVVCFLQRRLRWRGDELFQRRHERADLLAAVHAGDAVIAARNDAEQAAVRRAVVRDGDGRIAVLRLERQNVRQCAVRRQVGRRDDKASLVVLDAGDHRRLGFNGLRAINKRQPAFLRQRDGQLIIGNGLHDRRHHGDIQRNGRLLALAEARQRRAERNIGRDTVLRRVAGDQQILAEGVARFGIVKGHWDRPPPENWI